MRRALTQSLHIRGSQLSKRYLELAHGQARREGRGVLFPSAHLGPWERVAPSLVACGVPLVTLARESYDPRFSRLYERLRGAALPSADSLDLLTKAAAELS